MGSFNLDDEVTLVVIGGPYVGDEIPVPEEGLVLGRAATGLGALPDDPFVSRKHAQVHWTRNGLLAIRDLTSTAGTTVNGQVVEVRELNEGDRVVIGGTTLSVHVLRRHGSAHATAVGGGSQVGGGQTATSGGFNVGGSVGGSVTQDNRKYKKTTKVKPTVIIDDDGWWARARGPAKFVVILGIAISLIGFGIFGYPILAGAGDQAPTQQAQRACLEKYPELGFEQNECMIKAAQQAHVDQPDRSQFFQLGGGLFFVGLVLTIIARLLPGASPRRDGSGPW